MTNKEPTDGGRGGLAFNSATEYDYTGSYHEEERVSSLPTAAEERRLLDDEAYDEEDDEGQVVVREVDGGNKQVVAPERSYKDRRHDRVVREGMTYKDAMEAVSLERERVELEKEGSAAAATGGGGKGEEGESVAVVSRWDDDSVSKASSAPRR